MEVVLEPAINVYARDEFLRRVQLLKDLAESVQVDVADGIFAKPKNFSDPKIAGAVLSPRQAHVHLMVADHAAALSDWLPILPGLLTFHIEAVPEPTGLLSLLRAEGIERGLGIGPETPLERVVPYLDAVDALLFVSVPPGKSGQKFDERTPDRVRIVHERFPRVRIGVDGGVTTAHFPALVRAGARRLSIGSALFERPDPRQAFLDMRRALRAALKEAAGAAKKTGTSGGHGILNTH